MGIEKCLKILWNQHNIFCKAFCKLYNMNNFAIMTSQLIGFSLCCIAWMHGFAQKFIKEHGNWVEIWNFVLKCGNVRIIRIDFRKNNFTSVGSLRKIILSSISKMVKLKWNLIVPIDLKWTNFRQYLLNREFFCKCTVHFPWQKKLSRNLEFVCVNDIFLENDLI